MYRKGLGRSKPLPYIITPLNLFRNTKSYFYSPSDKGKLLGFILR